MIGALHQCSKTTKALAVLNLSLLIWAEPKQLPSWYLWMPDTGWWLVVPLAKNVLVSWITIPVGIVECVKINWNHPANVPSTSNHDQVRPSWKMESHRHGEGWLRPFVVRAWRARTEHECSVHRSSDSLRARSDADVSPWREGDDRSQPTSHRDVPAVRLSSITRMAQRCISSTETCSMD